MVHMAPDLLPRNTEELMKQECLEANEPWEGFREFAVFCLEVTEQDQAGYMMGDTSEIFLKDLYREVTFDDARTTSASWIGNSMIETDFDHIPGLFRAAFLSDITGAETDYDGAEFLWHLPNAGPIDQVVRHPLPESKESTEPNET